LALYCATCILGTDRNRSDCHPEGSKQSLKDQTLVDGIGTRMIRRSHLRGCSKDVLEHSPEYDFFDIDGF
jgi:hypothetical protein